MSGSGRDVVAYLRAVERRLRRLREPIDARPFIALVQGRLDRRLRAEPDAVDALISTLADLGWGDDAGVRRWHRWRFEAAAYAVERADVEDALHHLGITIGELYPELDEDFELGPDGWCGACAERVTPRAERPDACPWCGGDLARFELPRVKAPATESAPMWVTRQIPRNPRGTKPRYLDVMLNERRRALEAFVEHGSWKKAAATIRPGIFSGSASAMHALRDLARREGWLSSTDGDRSAAGLARRTARAREAVRAALADGTWSRVREPAPSFNVRDMLDEIIVREAAWLYFYDNLSFNDLAARLLHRTRYKGVKSLASAIRNEWDRRGWPRRTTSALSRERGFVAPTNDRRCATIKDGTRCRKWASRGERWCFDHNPASVPAIIARGKAASDQAYADAVDVGPWCQWLRLKALPEAGSVRAIHRRIGGRSTINYDTLADWTRPHSQGPPRSPRVRRATVQRILAAWNDGTTFEDIYVPIPDQQEVADAA